MTNVASETGGEGGCDLHITSYPAVALVPRTKYTIHTVSFSFFFSLCSYSLPLSKWGYLKVVKGEEKRREEGV